MFDCGVFSRPFFFLVTTAATVLHTGLLSVQLPQAGKGSPLPNMQPVRVFFFCLPLFLGVFTDTILRRVFLAQRRQTHWEKGNETSLVLTFLTSGVFLLCLVCSGRCRRFFTIGWRCLFSSPTCCFVASSPSPPVCCPIPRLVVHLSLSFFFLDYNTLNPSLSLALFCNIWPVHPTT